MTCNSEAVKNSRMNVYIFIIIAILFSTLYLYFITDTLLQVIDPECIRCNGSVYIFPFLKKAYMIKCTPMDLNEVGDYYAGLLAVLSTLWLVIAFIWQARELSLQRDEFIVTNNLNRKRNIAESSWQNTQNIISLISELKSNCNMLVKLRSKILNEAPISAPLSLQGCINFVSEKHNDQLKSGDPLKQEHTRIYNNILKESTVIVKIIVEKLPYSNFKEIL